jgi:LacI family transcriptional regulator
MSLRFLASTLGLSTTTVSRALAGYQDVAPGTRARVQAEAARIGYRPNQTARRLQSGRGGAVGLVLPTEPGQFDDPFFLRLLAGIGPALATADLDLLVMTAMPGPDELRVYRQLLDGRVQAVLLARTRSFDERIAFLLDNAMPFVAHGRTQLLRHDTPLTQLRPYACVDTDGTAAFADITQMLINLGHRRIFMLNALATYHYAEARARGWRAALQQASLPPGTLREAEPNEAEGERIATLMLKSTNAPTALVCATDRLAIGAMAAANKLGRVVGRDIAITGFDNLPAARATNPGLTTIEQPIERAGRVMVDLMRRLLAGEAAEGLQITLPTARVLRASHGPAPLAS